MNITAIHESAHAIISMLGYSYKDTVVNYWSDQKTNEIPTKISIKANNISSGSVSIPRADERSDQPLDPAKASWHIIELLAGYAAETAYEIDKLYSDNEVVETTFFEHTPGQPNALLKHDFFTVADIIENVYYERDNHHPFNVKFPREKYIEIIKPFWEKALEVVMVPVVKTAICNLANILEEEKEILESKINELRLQKIGTEKLDTYTIELPLLKV